MYPYKKRKPYTYKSHLENILYHIEKARREMQKEKDRWQTDVQILYSLESNLTALIKEEEQKETSNEE